MITRCMCNRLFVLRNISGNSQINWTLNLKFNSWKECRLFHASSVCFTTKKRPDNSEDTGVSNLKVLKVWEKITVREVSSAMKISLRDFGLLVPDMKLKPNDEIHSFDIISGALRKCGWKLEVIKRPTKVEKKPEKTAVPQPSSSDPKNLVKRPPVVTIMGHVDHGKTTLLDSLRNTFVVKQEFGGITQHIGAFSVEVKPGERITFIDTPGHAAFTTMRSRGAEVTDLVVLVIAADDGVMEQTVESIKIATTAQVPIVVAVNKIDKPTALPIEDIKQKLLWEGIQVEDHGGDVQLVPISALKKINLDLLTEVILLQAEMMNLKGDPTCSVEGVVIESKRGHAGILATIIVKSGTLRKEKILVAGKAYAKIRKMLDENGNEYKEALPSTPVQVLGWKQLPSPGDEVLEVKTEKHAKAIISELERKAMMEKQETDRSVIEKRAAEHQKQHHIIRQKFRSLTWHKDKQAFFFEWNQQRLKEQKEAVTDVGPHLKVLLKDKYEHRRLLGDVYGSLEVLIDILGSYNKEDECKLSIVNASVGDIKSEDLEIADTFGALIYAFNVKMDESSKGYIKEKTVDIRYHSVLYKLIDDIKEELSLRIPPKDGEEINGEAEVLQNFLITHERKKVSVAGARCLKGQLNKDSLYRVVRDGQVVHEGKLEVMKNEKKVVKTITKGMECGLMFESFPDKFQPGDKIICYDVVKSAQKTTWEPGF